MNKQKFEYLKNEKSFLDEKKTFFIVFEGLSFSEKRKCVKKIEGTSFNIGFSSLILSAFFHNKTFQFFFRMNYLNILPNHIDVCVLIVCLRCCDTSFNMFLSILHPTQITNFFQQKMLKRDVFFLSLTKASSFVVL